MLYDIYVLEHELDKKDSDEVVKNIVTDLSENYKTEHNWEEGATIVVVPDIFNPSYSKEEREEVIEFFIKDLRKLESTFSYFNKETLSYALMAVITSHVIDQIRKQLLDADWDEKNILNIQLALVESLISLLKMSNKDEPHVLVLNRAWYSIITRSKYLKTIRGYHESLTGTDMTKYNAYHANLTEDEKVFLNGYFDLRAFIGDINDGYQTDKAINITPMLLTKGKAMPVSLKKTMSDLNLMISVDGESFEYNTIEVTVNEDNTLESSFHELVR